MRTQTVADRHVADGTVGVSDQARGLAPSVVAPAQERAFAIRRANFSGEIHFHAPGLKRYETEEWVPERTDAFVPIRLTGTACALNCDHCRGTILAAMQPVPRDGLYALCARLADRGVRGVILSGASNRQGQVGLRTFEEEIRRVKQSLPLRVLAHTGLVDRAQAGVLQRARIDAALVDIIGAEETIRKVYHLKAGVGAFEESMKWLAEYSVPILPHIVLGLHYGRFWGEGAALDLVARYPIRALVLVVLTPLLATGMAQVRPPAPEEVAAFFARTRGRLPRTPVVLGCARPGGTWKEAVDRAAIDSGLNGIAYPAGGIVAYARRRGLRPRFHETCCGVEWALEDQGP